MVKLLKDFAADNLPRLFQLGSHVDLFSALLYLIHYTVGKLTSVNIGIFTTYSPFLGFRNSKA